MTDAPPNATYHILLIEDDLGDAGLVRIAIRRGSYPVTLHHVKNANEALGFLRRVGSEYREAPRPHLILLDLNLPGRSGHEILEELKGDRSLRGIPVVVLSTSEADRDIQKAYHLGANSFLSKPMDVEDFSRAIHATQDYWFRVVRLPLQS
ncbi:MAG TPA: response regulator [Magnetospirillum sp.]|jgi:CheY-like chemotaxis protein|nr:response regulator [Magnetospirillum sp.]